MTYGCAPEANTGCEDEWDNMGAEDGAMRRTEPPIKDDEKDHIGNKARSRLCKRALLSLAVEVYRKSAERESAGRVSISA